MLIKLRFLIALYIVHFNEDIVIHIYIYMYSYRSYNALNITPISSNTNN